MTVIKVNKDAVLRKSKHVYRHDDIVCKVLREMRRLGMSMIEYDESGEEQTVLKFEKKV